MQTPNAASWGSAVNRPVVRCLVTPTDKTPRSTLLAVVSICLAVIVAYGGTLCAGFVFDDYGLIVASDSIHNMWRPSEAFGSSYWGGAQRSTLYRPLPALSLGIEYKMWGIENPGGYHAVSLALHAFTCIAVFLARDTATAPSLVMPRLALCCWGHSARGA